MLASFDLRLLERFGHESSRIPLDLRQQRENICTRLDNLKRQVSETFPTTANVHVLDDDKPTPSKRSRVSDSNPPATAVVLERLSALKKQRQFIDLIDELDNEYLPKQEQSGRGEAAKLETDEYDEEKDSPPAKLEPMHRSPRPQARESEEREQMLRPQELTNGSLSETEITKAGE